MARAFRVLLGLLVLTFLSGPTVPSSAAPEQCELAGISPGRVVTGEMVLIYGRGIDSAFEVVLEESGTGNGLAPGPEPSGRSPRSLRVEHNEAGTAGWFFVPTDLAPGSWSVRLQADGPSIRAVPLRVEPARVERYAPGDRNKAWPLVSGQTVLGRFHGGRPLGFLWDYQAYYFVGAKGSTVSLSMERVDTSRPWEHPDSLDPALDVVGAGGFVYENLSGTDNRPSVDLNASIRKAVLRETGIYLVLAGTTRGQGDYRLTFRRESAAPAADGDRILGVGGEGMTVRVGSVVPFHGLALDPRGLPLAGAMVDLTGGVDLKGQPAQIQGPTLVETTLDGFYSSAMVAAGTGMGYLSPRTVALLPSPLSLPGVDVVVDTPPRGKRFHAPVAIVRSAPRGIAENGAIQFIISKTERLATERAQRRF